MSELTQTLKIFSYVLYSMLLTYSRCFFLSQIAFREGRKSEPLSHLVTDVVSESDVISTKYALVDENDTKFGALQ